jgi:hypothetical protein
MLLEETPITPERMTALRGSAPTTSKRLGGLRKGGAGHSSGDASRETLQRIGAALKISHARRSIELIDAAENGWPFSFKMPR